MIVYPRDPSMPPVVFRAGPYGRLLGLRVEDEDEARLKWAMLSISAEHPISIYLEYPRPNFLSATYVTVVDGVTYTRSIDALRVLAVLREGAARALHSSSPDLARDVGYILRVERIFADAHERADQ